MFRAKGAKGRVSRFFCRAKNKLPIKASLCPAAQKFFNKALSFSAQVLILFLVLFSISIAQTQDLPEEIRGYKVQKADVSIKNKFSASEKNDNTGAFITIGEPTISEVSITGITLEISGEIESSEQSGKIDFLAFKDFRVNGIAVEIEEYKNSFEFKKNRPVILPKPIKVFINTGQALRGALKERQDSKDEWTVTGTVFVFGRFKKSFLKFKRVVPVEINLKIKNPLKTIVNQDLSSQMK